LFLNLKFIGHLKLRFMVLMLHERLLNLKVFILNSLVFIRNLYSESST